MWVEISKIWYKVIFDWSHPHGCVSWNFNICNFNFRWLFTPSRVCELKYQGFAKQNYTISHTLTGVWVEICWDSTASWWFCGHTLTGVWVEINVSKAKFLLNTVTPSRVCELKYFCKFHKSILVTSHPHGCVSWNWIAVFKGSFRFVTPSRVCELKFLLYFHF